MTKRFILMAVLVAGLLAVVWYSKWNPEIPRVSGMIEADEIRLGSRVGGRVARVLVEEGAQVRASEVLVQLEPFDLLERELQLKLELAAREAEYQRFLAGFRDEEKAQAKAKVEQLQARLDLLQSGPRPQEIEAARARLVLAEAAQQLARSDFERIAKLSSANAASQQELDSVHEAFEAAQANVLVRQQELDLLEAGTRSEEVREAQGRVEEARQAWRLMTSGYRSEEIAQAKAARDAAQAALAALQRQQDELQITSPIDGTIEALDLQPGDMVAPGAPVLSMLDLNKLWVRAYVPQNRVGLQVGQLLPISVDSYPAQRFEGRVIYVARQAEFTPSNVQTPEERSQQVFRIKLAIENPHGWLRPGMTVDVWLDEIGRDHE